MKYPQQSQTVHVEMLNDELCLYDWQRKEVHALNPTAALVWQLCDGQTTPQQMAGQLKGDLNAEQAEALVWASLEQLGRANLLLEGEIAKPAGRPVLNRRQMLKVLGGAAAGAALLPVVSSIVAPRPVAAQSPVDCPPVPVGNWDLQGDAVLDGDWIRLTDASTDQGGAALYPDAFPFGANFTISFEYADYGGTGADGLCVFFYDGSAAYPPTLGRYGGPLTYSASPVTTDDGLSDAYLGVGFDEYGNFSEPGECTDGPGRTPQSVVLRGSGDGASGYAYLTGVDLTTLGQTVDGVVRATPRKVRVNLNNNLVTVEMNFGSGYQTIIDQYDLSTAPGQIAAPDTLRVGIGASTGGATNYHEITNFGFC